MTRVRKNSFERKCIGKAAKRLWKDATPAQWKLLNKTEIAARKIERAVMGYDVKVKSTV